jgi:hypothetical protein
MLRYLPPLFRDTDRPPVPALPECR